MRTPSHKGAAFLNQVNALNEKEQGMSDPYKPIQMGYDPGAIPSGPASPPIRNKEILQDRTIITKKTLDEANSEAYRIVARTVRVVALASISPDGMSDFKINGYFVAATGYACPCCGHRIEEFK